MAIEFEDGVAVVAAGDELAVAGGEIDVAVVVRGRRGVGLPDAAFARVGRRVEYGRLFQRALVVGHHKTVIGLHITRGAPRHDDLVVGEQKAGAGVLAARIEVGCADLDRTAELLDAGGDGEGMETLHEARHTERAAFAGAGEDVERAAREIDDRRGRDADFGMNERAEDVASVECADAAWLQEADVPETFAAGVGIEGVDAVVFGRDVEDVVRAFAGDRDARYVERLGVNVAVNIQRVQLAESARGDRGGREDGFVQIGAGALSHCDVVSCANKARTGSQCITGWTPAG